MNRDILSVLQNVSYATYQHLHLFLLLSTHHTKLHNNTLTNTSYLNQNKIHLQQAKIEVQNIKWKHSTQSIKTHDNL
jgi:hypothetical protein